MEGCSSNPIHTGEKRKREEEEDSLYYQAKREKRDSSLARLPIEIVHYILSFLDAKSLHIFGNLSKGCAKQTEVIWEHRRRVEHLLFDWSVVRHDSLFPHRQNYWLGKACVNYNMDYYPLFDLILGRYECWTIDKLESTIDKIKTIYNRFEKFIKYNDPFGAYVRISLSRYLFHTIENVRLYEPKCSMLADYSLHDELSFFLSLPPIEPGKAKEFSSIFQKLPFSLQVFFQAYASRQTLLNFKFREGSSLSEGTSLQELFKQMFPEANPHIVETFSLVENDLKQLIKTEDSKGEGGESLLEALFKCTEPNSSEEIPRYFKQAIECGATCGSLFAFHLFYKRGRHEQLKKDYIPLAIESVKRGDDRGLEALFQKYPGYSLILHETSEEYHFPAILAYLEEGEKCVDLTGEYNEMKGSQLLNELVAVKLQLKQWEKAENLIIKRFIIEIKDLKDDWKTKDFGFLSSNVYRFAIDSIKPDIWKTLIDKVIENRMRKLHPILWTLLDLIFLKVELEKWKEADFLCTQVEEFIKRGCLPELYHTGYILMKIELLEVRSWIRIHKVLVKLKLEEQDEVQRLYTAYKDEFDLSGTQEIKGLYQKYATYAEEPESMKSLMKIDKTWYIDSKKSAITFIEDSVTN